MEISPEAYSYLVSTSEYSIFVKTEKGQSQRTYSELNFPFRGFNFGGNNIFPIQITNHLKPQAPSIDIVRCAGTSLLVTTKCHLVARPDQCKDHEGSKGYCPNPRIILL